MDQYDSNVQVVMDFLEAEHYSKPDISVHRVCYRQFRMYLQKCNCKYRQEKGAEWQKLNEQKWREWRVKANRICLKQLDDVYKLGYPRKYHPYADPVWYGQLSPGLNNELDHYMSNFNSPDKNYRKTVQMECSDFLLFIQFRGRTSIREVDYDDVSAYYYHETDRMESTRRLYISQARGLLRFYASQGLVKHSLYLTMNTFFIHQVISTEIFSPGDIERINELRESSQDFPADEMWAAIAEFEKVLEEHRYSKTCKKYARHVLTLLFVFLEMHDLGYLPEIAQIWYHYEKSVLQSNWRMARKSLTQFEEFTLEGNICTGKTNVYHPVRIDLLPEWCKTPLNEFLILKKREYMKKSTIDMYRSSNVRLCEFLVNEGVRSFDDVTADHMNRFNLFDKHSTLEGKNAYNVRIRNFLIYLEEEGMIRNQFLHKVLLCTFAPRERVVQTLNSDEIAEIESYNKDATDAYGLRRSAMILLGLKMGLRASDIVNLKFTDIDLKERTIRLIQEKTLTEELLPMPVTVGNAVFRYITQGRPLSRSTYIFIHHKVPYDKLKPEVCRKSLMKVIPGRRTKGMGFHVTRKTFATSLLNNGVNVDAIIDSLGQRSRGTVYRYLSLDGERMLMCPLSFQEAGIPLLGGGSEC